MAIPKLRKKKARALSKIFDTKHLGDEPTFDIMPDDGMREHTKIVSYNWYNYFYTAADNFAFVILWAEQNGYTKEDIKGLKCTHDYNISASVQRLIRMTFQGWVLDTFETARIHTELKAHITKNVKPVEKVTVTRKPTSSKILIELDELEDAWCVGEFPEYNLGLRQQVLKDSRKHLDTGVRDWIVSRVTEYNKVTSKNSKELGYHNISYIGVQIILKTLQRMLNDLDVAMIASTRAKKMKPKKAASAAKQISKLQFAKTHQNLTSVHPLNLIGAKTIWLYNTKYKHLVQLVSGSDKGFTIKGTTLQGLDPDKSFKLKLRKPDQVLPVILKEGKRNISKCIKALTTKPSEANGRVNNHTILLKVL